MEMNYIPLEETDDFTMLIDLHRMDEISKFLHIDEDNYFRYVTTTENVYYYKIVKGEGIIGGLHCEINDHTLYLSLFVIPRYQGQGYGTLVLKDIIHNRFHFDIKKVLVYIDEKNKKSIGLFERVGFIRKRQEEEMIEYDYLLNNE